MEEKQQTGKGSCCCGAAPFILGLVVALAFGWLVFPDMLYSQKQQPVAFSHAVHAEAGEECSSCHYLRDDGSFSGIPTTEACANCHADVLGESKAEADYVAKYVLTGKEVDWYVHQKQPDNVFFSHAAHSLETCGKCHADFTEAELCIKCHPSTEELDKQIPYQENALTGYSKTTMKMWQCERCHAHPDHYYEGNNEGNVNANNACYTCHK